MPLGTEPSFIADSTASSSPRSIIDTSLQVKRATRTYGRRREDPQPLDALQLSAEDRPASRNIVHVTAPPGLKDEVPPSSPKHSPSPSTSDEHDTTEGPEIAPLEYGWRKAIRDIDAQDDDDAEMPASAQEPSGSPKSSRMAPLRLESYDVFSADSSFEGLASQADIPPQSSLPPPSPDVTVPTARSRRSRIVDDSDSEHDIQKESSPSSSASKIFSPLKSGSSSTQPTSEDELPPRILTKSTSAGKQKAKVATRLSVQPLVLASEATSDKGEGIPAKNKKKKVKPPTKKDKIELTKERSRLAAEATVSIPKVEEKKWTKQFLLARISAKQPAPQVEQPSKPMVPTSDPIASFSSPLRKQDLSVVELDSEPSGSKGSQGTKTQLSDNLHDDHDSGEDSDLPEIGAILTKDLKKEKLSEMKRRALEVQKTMSMSDDSDDLEIVDSNPKIAVKEEEEHRRSTKKRTSEGRKRQLQLAKINPSKQSAKGLSAMSPSRKVHAGISSIISRHSGEVRLEQKELNMLLAAEAQKRALDVTRGKEEEWKKHGGRVRSHPEGQSGGLEFVLKAVAEKALDATEVQINNEDDEDDQNDGDWHPEMRGSASPEPADEEESEEDDDDDDDDDENLRDNDDMVVDNDLEEQEQSASNFPVQRRRVVESDSESGDENDENAPAPFKAAPSRSTSRELQTEEEEDKENNTRLMYDRSEDKENTAVVRHRPIGIDSHSSLASDDFSPLSSPTTVGGNSAIGNRGTENSEQASIGRRRPFKELAADDSPLPRQIQPSNLTQTFAEKLQQSSPRSSTLAPDPTLQPFFKPPASSSKSPIPQSLEGGDVFGTPTLLASSFSDLFESTTQQQTSPTRLKRADDGATTLKRTDTLELTQDVSTALQPAFEAKETLLRKADAIFEKEQGLVLESVATREPLSKKPTLYVNDFGFLTQTKPADGSPEVYVPSPSQALRDRTEEGAQISPSVQSSGLRAPLRTLSISSPYPPDSPGEQRRRLRKRDTTPPVTRNRISPKLGTPPRKLNAFDVLGKAQKAKKKEDLKMRPDLAELFENEAAESDEEDAFGFVKTKADDEEEEGEDLDRNLEELVDDAEMDKKAIAEELVQEKYREQLEIQDQEDEKFHQGLVQGDQRKKRLRAFGVDDSDEESEDDQNAKARRAMKKARVDIENLEADESTRAFAEAYNQTLQDNDVEDFAYLNQEEQPGDILADKMNVDEEEGEDDAEDSDREVEETVSYEQIREAVKQMREEGVEEVGMDPTDVSWIDQEDEEDMPRVRTVNTKQPKHRPQNPEQSEIAAMGAVFRKSENGVSHLSRQWYEENKMRNAGMSRSVGGSAITGHAKAKSKTGGGVGKGSSTSRSVSASASTSTSKASRSAPSMLSVISDKSRHFA